MNPPAEFDVDITHIRKHYDRLSFLYQLLWGEHIHHGYWEDNESVGRAQIQLMERLAEKAAIPVGASVLDIGCGLGGSAFWLAEQYNCRVTGLTISPVQARIATRKAKALGGGNQVQFQVADVNLWRPQPESIDVIWIMEMCIRVEPRWHSRDLCLASGRSTPPRRGRGVGRGDR